MSQFIVKPHQWRQRKGLSWPMCQVCGLLRLRNAATEWAVRMGCDNDEHPQYREMMRRLSQEAKPCS
jgi:hypothetical protein